MRAGRNALRVGLGILLMACLVVAGRPTPGPRVSRASRVAPPPVTLPTALLRQTLQAPQAPPRTPRAQAGACGASWGLATTPNVGGRDNFLNSISAASKTNMWAVGAADLSPRQTLVLRGNGTSWAAQPSPNVGTGGNYLYGVDALSATNVWAVGAYTQPSGTFQTLIEHYDGSAWTVAPSQNVGASDNYLNAVDGRAANDVWAVGYYDRGDGVNQTLVLHYDGTNWSIVSSPNSGGSSNYLYAVAAIASNDVWAAGFSYSATAGQLQTLIMHYDGTSWTITPSPNLGAGTANLLLGLGAPSSSDVWAVGFANGTNGFDSIILHWNGAAWALSPHSDGGGRLFRIAAVSAHDVWTVGASNDEGTLLEHWNGTAWTLATLPASVSNFNVLYGIVALGSGSVRAAGYMSAPGKTTTLVEQLCEQVVQDAGFSPPKSTGAFGSTVTWSFSKANGSSHSVTDNSGLGLFDSGLHPAGDSFSFVMVGAGTYSLIDTSTLHTGMIGIPVTAVPPSGGLGTTFTITWASGPFAGHVFDVQIRRPGSSTWSDWKVDQTGASATFVPDNGTGTYSFRARTQDASNGRFTAYSPFASIVVS